MSEIPQNNDNVSERSENSTEKDNQESEKYNPFVEFEEKENHFKTIGFWCGLNNPENPSKSFNVFFQNYIKTSDDRMDALKTLHIFDKQRFEKHISKAEEDIEIINEKLRNLQDISDTTIEIEKFREEIDKIEEALKETYQKFGEAKTKLIDKQIEDAFRELDSLTENYEEILRKHDKLNETARARINETLEIKPNVIKELKDKYLNAFNRLQQKAIDSEICGSWLIHHWYLKTFGFLTASAAGYFFSIFAIREKLSNAGVQFFTIKGLFRFIGVSVSEPLSLGTVLIILGSILALPFFILGIAYLCRLLIEKYKKIRKKDVGEFQVSFNEENDFLISAKLESEDFYSFWLRIMPPLFIIIIVFIIVTFGYFILPSNAIANTAVNNTMSNIEDLDTSLSAFTNGTIIAVAFAGVFYIYVLNIIEPRLRLIAEEDKNNKNTPQTPPRRRRAKFFLANFELILIIFITLALLFSVLFGMEKNFFFNIPKLMQDKIAFVAFLMFIVSVLLTAFTLGYGMYFSGITDARDEIEKKVNSLTQKLSYNSFPSIKPALLADRIFGMKYGEIVENLMQLVLNRTKLAKQFIPENSNQLKQKQDQLKQRQDQKTISKFLRYLPNSLRKIFSDKRSEAQKIEDELAEIDNQVELLPEDEHYFPEITGEINNLRISKNELRKRRITLEKDIKDRLEENSDYIKKLKENKTRLEEQIKGWRNHISFLNREQFKEIERFSRKLQREISELNDGFNLALWFIDNGGKPPQIPFYNGNN